MSVPDTTTFTLKNVQTELEIYEAKTIGTPQTIDSLQLAISNSISVSWDDTYSGSKDSLYNFRNYTVLPDILYSMKTAVSNDSLPFDYFQNMTNEEIKCRVEEWFILTNRQSAGRQMRYWSLDGINIGTIMYGFSKPYELDPSSYDVVVYDLYVADPIIIRLHPTTRAITSITAFSTIADCVTDTVAPSVPQNVHFSEL